MQTIKDVWKGALKWIRDFKSTGVSRSFLKFAESVRIGIVNEAHAYFPDERVKQEYEEYINKGRAFARYAFWREEVEPIKIEYSSLPIFGGEG